MTQMYDSINVEAIPADAQAVLVYTDGKYANETAMRARFPNATIQTISAVGQVPGMWIDCEIGCVWPPAAAVSVYKAWAGKGCKGFYSTVATQQALKEELAHQQISPLSVEWFDADWNNVPHIDAGDNETQFESLPGYDVSEIPDPPPTPKPPAPAPTPPKGPMALTPADLAAIDAQISHALVLILYGDSQAAAEGKVVQGHPFNLMQMNETLNELKADMATLKAAVAALPKV